MQSVWDGKTARFQWFVLLTFFFAGCVSDGAGFSAYVANDDFQITQRDDERVNAEQRLLVQNASEGYVAFTAVEPSSPFYCQPFFHKNGRRHTILGCQDSRLVDLRNSVNLSSWVARFVDGQACLDPTSKTERRFFVVNDREFFFVDQQRRSVYFVPADYVTDAVSFPELIREILPGSLFEPINSKTLVASQVHDRYLCLSRHSDNVWPDIRDELSTYRQKKCVNDAFKNAARTAGSSAFFSTISRTMVGIFNPQIGEGYCPDNQIASIDALEFEFERLGLRQILASSSVKQVDCLPQELLTICMTRADNLTAIALDPKARVSAVWRGVFGLIACHDARARLSHQSVNPKGNCDLVELEDELLQLKRLQPSDDGLLPSYPFLGGDLLIEASPLLITELGRQQFLELAGTANNIDQVMRRLVEHNFRRTYPSKDERS